MLKFFYCKIVPPKYISIRGLLKLLLVLPFLVPAAAIGFLSDAEQQRLDKGRAIYNELKALVDAKQWREFDRRRSELDGYPLAAYADYERLLARARVASGSEAKAFVDANTDSPIGVRFLGHYLSAAGRDKRWGDYLVAAAKEPRSERLRCYYARAKRGRGQQAEAWSLANDLFLSGQPVDDACDPLFRLWKGAGHLTDELVWDRAKLAFQARQGGLLRYVASLASQNISEQTRVLRRIYREPDRALSLSAGLPAPVRAEVLTLGLERFSRYQPTRALRDYQRAPVAQFSDAQKRKIEAAIAFRGLVERETGVLSWVDANLDRWQDDQLTEMRMRWAIAESDWVAITETADKLSAAKRDEDVWRYWLARSLEARGNAEQAGMLFQKAADSRSYYGFLSADRLGLPYNYRDMPIPIAPDKPALSESMRLALLRVHELYALDEARSAQSEWTHLLQRSNKESQQYLAEVALDQGWYRLSIDAANFSQSWDALNWRFPLAYREAFERRAANEQVPVSEIMAIARRESAFFPAARSPVGARGLMQLMPATGRAVAKRKGANISTSALYDIDLNLDLGSAYYKELLERFDGSRPQALAAYNAGPNRVQHWIDPQLSTDAWIETIPYRETRDYVKAVLAYSVVFDFRMGNQAQLLALVKHPTHP